MAEKKTAAKSGDKKTVTVRQIRSAARRPAIQAQTLRGLGLGKIAQPIRVAVSGISMAPPIDATLFLLGRTRTLARLAAASGSA